MGGKGSTPPPPQMQDIQQPDFSAMLEPMYGQMYAFQEAMARNQESMMMSQQQPPPITPRESVDWDARRKALQEEMTRDVTADVAGKRGRASTVLTSTLEEEEPVTTSSVLTGV